MTMALESALKVLESAY